MQYSQQALLFIALFDPYHRAWNNLKTALKRAKCNAWKTVLELTLVANLNYGPFGSSAWHFKKKAKLEDYLLTRNASHARTMARRAQYWQEAICALQAGNSTNIWSAKREGFLTCRGPFSGWRFPFLLNNLREPQHTPTYSWNITQAFHQLCWGLNSQCFSEVGMVINLIVGVYIPIVRIPYKGGMTIPNMRSLDPATTERNSFTKHHKVLFFFFRVCLSFRWISLWGRAYFQGLCLDLFVWWFFTDSTMEIAIKPPCGIFFYFLPASQANPGLSVLGRVVLIYTAFAFLASMPLVCQNPFRKVPRLVSRTDVNKVLKEMGKWGSKVY